METLSSRWVRKFEIWDFHYKQILAPFSLVLRGEGLGMRG